VLAEKEAADLSSESRAMLRSIRSARIFRLAAPVQAIRLLLYRSKHIHTKSIAACISGAQAELVLTRQGCLYTNLIRHNQAKVATGLLLHQFAVARRRDNRLKNTTHRTKILGQF
jgi:hypothetical protein